MERSSLAPFRTISSRKPRVQSQLSSFGPDAMKDKSCPKRGTQVVHLRNSTAYSCDVKFPPQPQDSLPTPQKRTPNGSEYPAAARTSARLVLPAGALQYSTHS